MKRSRGRGRLATFSSPLHSLTHSRGPPLSASSASGSHCPSFRPSFSPLLAFSMSYLLPHLPSGWHVDQAILAEEDRVVVIRFGHDYDPTCMRMDETLYGIAEKVRNFAVVYLCDITEVPDFNKVSAPRLLPSYSLACYDADLVNLLLALRCTSSTTPARSCSSTETSTS